MRLKISYSSSYYLYLQNTETITPVKLVIDIIFKANEDLQTFKPLCIKTRGIFLMQVIIYPSVATLMNDEIHIPLHIHAYNRFEFERNGNLPTENCVSKLQRAKIFGKCIVNGMKLLKQQRMKMNDILLEIGGYIDVVQIENDKCFKQTIVLDYHGSDIIMIKATVGNEIFYGESCVYPDNGYAVISDIDDTIRVADGYDIYQFLSSSLYYNYTPVPGMSDVYNKWLKINNCRFYYISASPDQLYSEFSNFSKIHQFPKGQYMGRHFRWYYNDSQVSHYATIQKLMPLEGNLVVNEHQQEVQNSKEIQQSSDDKDMSDRIRHILTDHDKEILVYNHKYLSIYEVFDSHPQLIFVLVGDDTAHDPYIYAKIYSHFPKQVKMIYIRHIIKNNHLTTKSAVCNKEVQNLKDAKMVLRSTPHKIFTDPIELQINFNSF